MTPESGHVTNPNEAICSLYGATNQLMTTSEETQVAGKTTIRINRQREAFINYFELSNKNMSQRVVQCQRQDPRRQQKQTNATENDVQN